MKTRVCALPAPLLGRGGHELPRAATPAAWAARRRGYSAPADTARRRLNVPIEYSASAYLRHTAKAALAAPELPPAVAAASKTKRLNLYAAVNDALAAILAGNPRSLVFGEDVAFGGVFRCTTQLADTFGAQRVFNTPLTEQGILGFAVGLQAQGFVALPEIQFADYLFPAFDQLHNEASKWRYRSGGAPKFNQGGLVVRMPTGAVGHGGLYHSQSPEGFFAGAQGVRVVVPRGPAQAKGLLLAAAACHDPVVFMEPKILYRAAVEEVPVDAYTLPLDRAEVLQAGDDITVVSYGTMLYVVEQAARAAREMLGVSVEVIDLRTVRPWDKLTVAASVNKTGRCVVVHEASRTGGVGEGIAAEVLERCFLRLEAPVGRVCGWDTPVPLAFETLMIPDVASGFSLLRCCGKSG